MNDILKIITEKIAKYKEALNIKENFEVKFYNEIFICIECKEIDFGAEVWCDYYFSRRRAEYVGSVVSQDVRDIMTKFMELKTKMVEA